jgi:iron complex transport system substrate-binding protein
VHHVPAFRSTALAVVLALLTLACAGPAPSQTIPPDATGSAVPAMTSEPSAAAFPITVTDDEGTDVEIPAAPAAIVSLTPATTEILFELGVGDRVVATDSASDTPGEAADLPDVADFSVVDIEAIVGLEADLVIAGGLGFTPPDSVAQLRDLGIPVVVVYAPSVEAVYEDIELVGSAVGRAEQAAALATGLRAEMDDIAAAVAGSDAPRTFYEIGYTDATGQIFAPADESFVAEMVTLAGGDPITTGDASSYEIPLERLIAADPEIIVLGVNPFYMPTPEQVAARPGWDVMTALRADRVVVVQDTEITRPGPRLSTGLRNLAAAIHPDVTLPAAP